MSRSCPTLDILHSARAKTPKAIICTRNKAILTLEGKNAATVKPSRFFAFPFHSPTLFQVKAYFLFQLLHCWNNTGQVIWKVSACGWISSHGRMANICLLTAAGWIGSFSNDEDDGSENVKKAICWSAKQQLCTCSTHYCTFFCRHCTTTAWKSLISRFMEDMNKQQRIFLSLSKLECSPKKSTPGKFTYNWNFQRIGISATKFEKPWIHFKSDVFAAVAVVDSKTP